MASPTWVNGIEQATNGDTSVNRPSGIATGDVLLALLISTSSGHAVNIPSGWTLIETQASGGYETGRLYWKVVEGGDPSTETWASGNPGSVGHIIMGAWTGNAASPIDTDGSSAWSGTTTSFTAPSVTASEANTTLAVLIAMNAAAGTFSGIGTLTERIKSGTNKDGVIFDEAIAASGATGTRGVTSSVDTYYAPFSVILKGAGGGGGGGIGFDEGEWQPQEQITNPLNVSIW